MVTGSDVVIAGGGLIGLACAAAIGARGGSVILLDDRRPGEASPAAAGMLAPSIERAGAADAFADAARDRYPSYVEWLANATGIDVPLNRQGILQVAVSERGVRGLRRAMPDTARWLDRDALRAAEPALAHALGAVHHPFDGAVDNVVLIAALEEVVRAWPVDRQRTAAVEVLLDEPRPGVRGADGVVHRGDRVIIAAGAWTPAIRGLPRALPISPLRGQMLAFAGMSLEHVLFGPRGYIVPRAAHAGATRETLIGATSEPVGFDPSLSEAARRSLHQAGSEVIPALSAMQPTRQWAGLRPVTPDLLPIIGPEPDDPRLVYACGHSRNGILLAPLTADCIAAVVLGERVPHDLSPFRPDRFPLGLASERGQGRVAPGPVRRDR